MKKRFLAILLAALMVVSILPVSAFAADGGTVAKIGDTGYATLADAVAAAKAGDTVEITVADTYTVPNISKNITIKAADDVDVEFNCGGSGSIASVPNGATFENVTMNFGQSSYHGFQHAGEITMKNCVLNGLFFSYGDMNFDGCTFNAPGSEYSMWCYAGNITYTYCTVNCAGKFANVYNENNGTWNVTAENCTFNSTSAKKAALNVKENCCNGAALHFNITVKNCNATGSWPTTEGDDNATLLVINELVQIDDRSATTIANSKAGNGVKVTIDDNVVYPVAAEETTPVKPVQPVPVAPNTEKGIDDAVVAAVMKNEAVNNFTGTNLASALKESTDEAVKLSIKFELLTAKADDQAEGTAFLKFDVKPYANENVISNDKLNGAPITFRLPLTAAFNDVKVVKVIHYASDGNKEAYYEVQGEDNAKYVEISTPSFSKFDVLGTELTEIPAKDWEVIDDQKLVNIYTANGMVAFAESTVADQAKKYSGYEIHIKDDIDLTGRNWKAISMWNAENGFTLDGENHTITGLGVPEALTDRDNPHNYGAGLFTDVRGELNPVVIKNITFDSATVGVENGSKVAIIVGHAYNDITIENVTISNSKLVSTTKMGAFIGLHEGNNKGLANFINCKLVNTTVEGEYSFALMIGLEQNSDGIQFTNCSADENSTTILAKEFPTFPGCEHVTIEGYVYAIDDGGLWLLDPNGAWAEQRITNQKCTYKGTEYKISGGKFYYGDKVVTIPEVYPEAAANVAKIGETEYATLTEAVAAAKDGDIITIIADCNENIELNKQTIIVVNEGVNYTGDVTLAEGAEKMRLFSANELNYVSEMYNAFFDFTPAYVVAKYPDADVQIINCDNGDVKFADNVMDTAYSFNAFNVNNGDMAIFNKLLGEPSFASLGGGVGLEEIFQNYKNLSDTEKARVGEVLPWMLPYMPWIADFEVTFDKDVKMGSMGVGGYYGSYAKEEGGGLGMDIELDKDMSTTDVYRMLKNNPLMSLEIPYAGICLAVRTFNCGAYKLTNDIDGTTMTVSLHLYNGEEDIVIGTYDYRFPLAPVAAIGNTKYETLQSAFDAAIAGDTVKLLKNIEVTEQLLVNDGKNFNLDLAGKTIAYTGTEMLKSGVIGVKHDGALTVKDSVGSGAIKSGTNAYAAVAMTIPGDTDATKPAVLTVKGGTLEGLYYGIAGNGNEGRGNTKVFIQGGTVKATYANDNTAIYNPQSGTLVISGGTVEGANGVYVKAGNPVTVSGGTIKGSGPKGDFEHNGSGVNNTGDAFIVENCGYPGGAPVPTITGGTFISEKNQPIASYAYGEGNEPIGQFVKDGKFNKRLGEGLAAEGLKPTTVADEDDYYTVKPEEVVAPHEHSFGIWTSDNESTHSRICECGEVEIGAHEFGAPTVSWTFPANGNVTATYSTTCSVCGKQIIKYQTALKTEDSNDKVVWTATATIGGKQYTATKEVAKSYTVSVPGGFTGGGNYAYGATVKVAPNSTGVNYDFALNGAPAAFNASSLTFKVTGNVEVTATEYVKPVEVKPVLTMAVDGSSTISKDSAGKYKVPFKISWAIEKNSGIEVIEVGYIYRYGGKDFATIDTDTVLAKGSVKTSSLKSLNGSYKCTHSFGSSYAGRYIYAVGYMTYKLNGVTHTIYTDEIGTNNANCCATLNK